MARKRRIHSKEFKLEAVRLLRESGLKISQVAADLDVTLRSPSKLAEEVV